MYTINKYLIKISDKNLVKRLKDWYNFYMKNFLPNLNLAIIAKRSTVFQIHRKGGRHHENNNYRKEH